MLNIWTANTARPQCPGPAGTRSWTGAVGTDWNTAGNWSPGCVPTAADDVVIPNAANAPVISAAAKTVWVQTDGALTINIGTSLTVNGSFQNGSFTQAVLNNGTVRNSGTLSIGNTANVGEIGLRNEAAFSNNAGGQIPIDRSFGSGLYNNSGAFTNAGAITFLGNVPSGSGCAADYTVTRTWEAEDLCGNTATTSQVITVQGNSYRGDPAQVV